MWWIVVRVAVGGIAASAGRFDACCVSVYPGCKLDKLGVTGSSPVQPIEVRI